MKKMAKEWTVDATWGKIAMVSWGDPANPPVLMGHGYMDSAATFILLVEQLPDTYYYVAFDVPGHGKSDPFCPGPIVSQLSVVEAVRLIVDSMNWHKFIYIGHSMAICVGIFYNHLYPGKIEKMVLLDPVPALAINYYPHYNPFYWYQFFYHLYYDDYDRWNAGISNEFTFEEAVKLIARRRNFTEEQAKVTLSRSLVPTADGKFKLSWEPRMKKMAQVNVSEETLITAMTENATPTLIVKSLESISTPLGIQFAESVLEKCFHMSPNFYSVTVKGSHDVHVTHPENVAPHIIKFFKSYCTDSGPFQCKL